MLIGLIHQKIKLKCLNTLGRISQIMEYYSYRKLIPLMTLSSIGITILKVNCFFSHETTISCGVMIGYLGSNKVNRIKNDNQGRILIVDADINEETFVLINVYNANTETEQIKTIYELDQLLSDFLDSNKNIILAGDFNLFFDPSLEGSGGKPALKKKKSISKLLHIFEQNNLVDIWRIRNPSLKRYTFRKNHFSGFIQRRLDYIFISNNIQEYFEKVSILPSFCSDHSPISCILESSSKIQLGKNFWKFNSSLINDEKYVTQIKQHISEVKSQFNCFWKQNSCSAGIFKI